MSMLGYSLGGIDAERPGPFYNTGTYPHRFTAGSAKILSKAGIRAQIVSVLVDTKDANTTLNIYEGTNSSGTLIASMKLSKRGTFPMFFQVAGGLYVSCMGGGGSAILVVDAATYNSGLLTLSGNEITDATRSAATLWATGKTGGSVDQFTPPDSSYGIWEAGTNLFRHGQCDAVGGVSFDGYTRDYPVGHGSITIDATTPAPFSPQSIKVTFDATAAGSGVNGFSNNGQAAAAGAIGSGSIWFKGTQGEAYTARSKWLNTDASATGGTILSFNATGSWQLLSPAPLAVAVGKTGDVFGIEVDNVVAAAETFWVAHPMVQIGPSVASPYIATTGGATAARVAARVQAPSPFTATQGWVAVRARLGFPSTDTTYHGIFEWGDDANNLLQLYFKGSDQKWHVGREAASNLDETSVAATHATNDVVTLIFAWDAGNLYFSINGGVFTSVASVNIPTLAAKLFDVGNKFLGTAGVLDGDVLWTACGSGTLSNADAATINGFGSTDHLVSDFPGSCKLFWPADTSRYYTP